ncbi:prepilin peptidase [Humidesulfovibrio sp.]
MPAHQILPSALLLPVAGLLGLILGSFATCAGHRLAHGGSVLSPARSYCPACGRTLSWRDNIPLLGWLLQGGRCRFCRARISARYPLTELASGGFALCAMAVFGVTPHFLAALAFATLWLVLSLIDLETYLLPDALTLPGAAAAFTCSALLPPLWTLGIGWERALAGGLLGGGGLWLAAVLYRRVRGVDGLGLGDAKLMLLVGALLGPAAVGVTLFGGACLALPAGLAAMRRAERKNASSVKGSGASGHNNNQGDNQSDNQGDAPGNMDTALDGPGQGLQTRLPFGPFLCAAAAGYLLGGPWLLHWWLGLPLP